MRALIQIQYGDVQKQKGDPISLNNSIQYELVVIALFTVQYLVLFSIVQ